MQQVIGVDLGGTAIKVGRFNRAGDCLQFQTVATPQPQHPEPVIEAIAEAIAAIDPDGHALAVGVGTPGPTDAAGRVARIAINLPGWLDVNVAERLEALIHKPVVIGNDANCAGLGEAWLGAGAPFQNLILLTLGTGAGGCIILNDQLYVGQDGAAGELGLVTLDPSGPACHSGNSGSLEQYVSAQAVRRETGREPLELADLAALGVADARQYWQTYGRRLAQGLVSSIYVLNPEAVIIGGGISAAARWFLPATEAEIHRRIRPRYRRRLKLLTATLGNRAGVVGAAKLAWEHLKQTS